MKNDRGPCLCPWGSKILNGVKKVDYIDCLNEKQDSNKHFYLLTTISESIFVLKEIIKSFSWIILYSTVCLTVLVFRLSMCKVQTTGRLCLYYTIIPYLRHIFAHWVEVSLESIMVHGACNSCQHGGLGHFNPLAFIQPEYVFHNFNLQKSESEHTHNINSWTCITLVNWALCWQNWSSWRHLMGCEIKWCCTRDRCFKLRPLLGQNQAKENRKGRGLLNCEDNLVIS